MSEGYEQDRDDALARRFGAWLDAGARPDDLPDDDALGDALRTLRQDADAPVAAERRAALWRAVESEIDLPPRARIHRLVPLRWAAAAVLLAAVGLAWWLTARTPGDVLVAQAEDAVLGYTAPDGSTVRLRPRSRLFLVSEADDALRYRLEGEAYFVVVEEPRRMFSVVTDEATVTVLGTTFTVSTWGDATQVYLAEGRVRLTAGADGAAAEMAPGQRAAVRDGTLAAPVDAPAAVFTDWLSGNLVLDATPLTRVLAEVEHHYGIRLDARSAGGGAVSGTLLLGDRDAALRDLGRILGGRFERTDDDAYRFALP